jgi:hypothetical protein
MTFSRPAFSHILPLALIAGVALVPVGCGGRGGVEKYNVPKTTDTGRAAAPAPAAGEYRILGAMFPTGQPGWYWYFKFAGPADQISAQEASFDAMAKSVKLQANAASLPSFDLPDGWARTGPRVDSRGGVQVRFDEVLKVGALECTVSHVGGGKEFNLDRWAGQVGAAAGAGASATTEFVANGVTALRVDLRGPKNPVGARGPMMPAGHP